MMNQLFNIIISAWAHWFDCIQSPLKSCRNILNSTVSRKEKIDYAFYIWLIALLLSFSLEATLCRIIGINVDTAFLCSYFAYAFFYAFIPSFFTHISFRIFKIKSVFHETFIIYAMSMGAYSPFIILMSYPILINNALVVTMIKKGNMPALNNLPLLFFEKINYEPSIVIISSFMNLIYLILYLVLTVLLGYAVIERYNCNKFRTFLSITFSQIILLAQGFPILIKDVILFIFKHNFP